MASAVTESVTAMLNLRYSPDVPKAMIEMLEHYGKRMGLPLDEMERLGGSLEAVETFLNEVEGAQEALFRDLALVRSLRAGTPMPRDLARA